MPLIARRHRILFEQNPFGWLALGQDGLARLLDVFKVFNVHVNPLSEEGGSCLWRLGVLVGFKPP